MGICLFASCWLLNRELTITRYSALVKESINALLMLLHLSLPGPIIWGNQLLLISINEVRIVVPCFLDLGPWLESVGVVLLLQCWAHLGLVIFFLVLNWLSGRVCSLWGWNSDCAAFRVLISELS